MIVVVVVWLLLWQWNGGVMVVEVMEVMVVILVVAVIVMEVMVVKVIIMEVMMLKVMTVEVIVMEVKVMIINQLWAPFQRNSHQDLLIGWMWNIKESKMAPTLL